MIEAYASKVESSKKTVSKHLLMVQSTNDNGSVMLQNIWSTNNDEESSFKQIRLRGVGK